MPSNAIVTGTLLNRRISAFHSFQGEFFIKAKDSKLQDEIILPKVAAVIHGLINNI